MVGAFALAQHGLLRATADVDFEPSPNYFFFWFGFFVSPSSGMSDFR